MSIKDVDVGLDVVASTESPEFVAGAAAVEDSDRFPRADVENPTWFRVV
jgi:hypothetical protein